MSSNHEGGAEATSQVGTLAALVHGALGHMTPTQRARGLQALTARLERARDRRPARMALFLSGGAAVAAALLLVLLPHARRAHQDSAPLAYQVEGGALDPSGTLTRAAGARDTVVRFADGTSVRLRAGTRGRLASVDHQGARFAIERGTADVQVTPRAGARWLFDAGPFLITVHGTVFTAGWDENAGRLDLRLTKGLVSVTGPVAGGPISVRDGQHLTVTLRQARVLLRGLDEPAAPAAAPVDSAPEERPQPARAAAVRAPAPHLGRAPQAAPSSTGWLAALAAGDFDAIVRDAEREGPRALATRGSDELAALADAARYRKHDDLARSALLAQRRRFPDSARASDAAFLLGRLEEAGTGGLAGAVKWYDRYLEEAPSGAYASEALGRKMVAIQKLYGTERARAVAEEYARRFPSGTYTGAARALRDTP